ncbi:MAG: long-chain-fatty-acid--CoA ligase [Deltaproteobacteria bacterium]|nr:long-chain-fatty-acid--CoA ligase [Deltaproteobacteria bacterium]
MLETSFGNILDKAFIKYKDRVAFKINGQVYTYREVESAVNKLANAFIGLGLKKGDRIVIMTTNCIEYLYADYAAAKAGLVMIPLNVMLTFKDIDYRIKDSGARTILLDEFFYQKVGLFFKDYDFVQTVIAVTDREEILSQGVIGFYRLLESSPSTPLDVGVEQDDLRAIMYTGGTTGESKGVMHTHKSYVSIIFSSIVEMDISEGEIMLQTAPLPHAAGFMIPPCLLKGGRVVITNGFNPEETFRLIQEEKITCTFMVPTMIYGFLDHPKRNDYDLSSLKTIMYGAAPISPRRLEEAMKAMGPIFMQAYSQMEVANQTASFTKRQHLEAIEKGRKERLKSCGMPIIMSQVRIVDEDDQDVETGKTGEIITRGPHMMKGYWGKEKETGKAIVGGWLHTGDIAYRDENGYLYLVDRKHDMIISGGMNVYSTEVEYCLAMHPALSEVIVIGIPDEKWGEMVLAIVVKAAGKKVSETELLEFCRENLTAYKRPKRIEFYEAIPRTAYGKLDKKAVRKKYWEGRERMI